MRFQEVFSIAASCLSFSHVKDHVTLEDPIPEVNLGYERHQAIVNTADQFYDFSNIRYGQDAGGNRRWLAPIEPEDVDDPPLSDGAEKICIQAAGAWFPEAVGFIGDWFNPNKQINETDWINTPNENHTWLSPPSQPSGASEDCLFLDVKVPFQIWKKKGKLGFKPAPVMIWIHGGGYAAGWKHQAGNPVGIFEQASTLPGTAYPDGVIFVSSDLPAQDIVNSNVGRSKQVAMNYRLGAFGWLSGSGILRGPSSPNIGWQDQTLAMNWVQEYIGLFGGDPDLVTVFGESAGASSILHHLTAYGGRGPPPPFKRAILQSPAFFPQPEPSQQEAAYEALLKEANVKNFTGLRALNSTSLIDANAWTIQKSNYGQFTFGPTADFFINPVLPGQALMEGHFHRDIDIMTAYNKREGLLFTPPYIQTNDSFHRYLQKTFPAADPAVIDEIAELYPTPAYNDTTDRGGEAKVRIDRLAQALGDGAVNCNTYYLQKAINQFTTQKSYAYYFALFPPFHGFDVPHTFYPENPPDPPLQVDADAAKLLQRYLVNFAKTGDLEKPGRFPIPLPSFPVYGRGQNIMQFRPLVGAESGVDAINTTLCDWWQMAYYY